MNVEVTLTDPESHRWVRANVADRLGLRLSHLVQTHVDWSRSTIRVFASDTVSEAELRQFEYGGKVVAAAADAWLLTQLEPFLRDRENYLVAEDWMARPSDKVLGTRNMPAFFHGEEVYYLMRGSEAGADPGWRRAMLNPAPLFHAYVIGPSVEAPPFGSNVSEAQLIAMASAVRLIICGAYDGESYVLCSFDSA